ncbi:hypothetical protein ACWEKT_35790 [Nocardia takedensis]
MSGQIGDVVGGSDEVAVLNLGTWTAYDDQGSQIGAVPLVEGTLRMCEIHFPNGSGTRGYTLRENKLAARGIEPARYEYFLTAWEFDSGSGIRKVWETRFASLTDASEVTCTFGSALRSTSDGKYLVISNYADGYSVIDAADGSLRTVDYEPAPIAGYLTRTVRECDSACFTSRVELIDPVTLSVVTTYSGPPGSGKPDPVLFSLVRTALDEGSLAFADNKRVAVYESVTDGMEIQVIDLATQTILVRIPVGRYNPMHDMWLDEKAGIVVYSQHSGLIGGIPISGFDLSDGHPLWKLDSYGKVCAVGNGQMNLMINDQMALLDTRTGQQLDYTTRPNACQNTVGVLTFNTDGKIYRLVD